MADFTFNIAKGYEKYYTSLPAANDALVIMLLQVAEDDSVLVDYDTFAAILAGSNTEANFTGYGTRKSITSVTATVDDTNDWFTATFANQTWTAAGGTTDNTLAKLIIGYDGDTTSGTDANIVPITAHDFIVTTNGTDLTAQLGATGFVVVQ